MFLQRNNEERSCNHCCSGKAVSITYSECVSAALVTQHAMPMRHIVICDPPLSAIFFPPHFLINCTIFESKNVTEHKMCVILFFSYTNISHSKKNWARYDQKRILVFMWSSSYSCQILVKLGYSRQIFENSPYMKFHENPSSGKPSSCWRTDGQPWQSW